MDHQISRRHLLVGGLLLLPGCAEFSSRTPYWATVRQLVPRGNNTRNELWARAREIRFASIEVGFGGSPQALMVLESFGDDGRLTWGGQGNQLIQTFGPLVVRLVGLEVELTDTLLDANWQTDFRQMVGRRATRQVRYRADRIVTVDFESRFEIDGEDTVELLSGPRRLLRIEERVSAPGGGRFSNSYWVDRDTGVCWRSRQLPVPTFPALNIRVMRRPNR